MNPGIRDLPTLLKSACPELTSGEFVFVALGSDSVPSSVKPLCTFREQEGLTLVCSRLDADAEELPYVTTYRQITLRVHSSLDAVRFLAAVTAALAQANIPCNAVSAFYHDHLFVPTALAESAIKVLESLTSTGHPPSRSLQP